MLSDGVVDNQNYILCRNTNFLGKINDRFDSGGRSIRASKQLIPTGFWAPIFLAKIPKFFDMLGRDRILSRRS